LDIEKTDAGRPGAIGISGSFIFIQGIRFSFKDNIIITGI